MTRRKVDPGLRRARLIMVGGTVILVLLGSYLLISMWEYAKGKPPAELLQEARDLARVGDDVRAVVSIERARKKTSDPKLTAQLDKLYRDIVVKRKMRVVEGLISARRYRIAELQLRSILAEQPDNQRAALLLKTVEAAMSTKDKEKRAPVAPTKSPIQAMVVGRSLP